ncbi:putative SEC14 [Danaus plexippus plexippus]|uniref:SEC14 n=1 Tax=Danaus plexippus plexippus TaxID=278856 RepID=A0A212F6S2_DANPL|nr:alpha-tocopherol transfer protein-like [Danaus plexippus plexippus]OWR49435.1 putative SEC14 [Danaus plexippus plexippus]
MNVRPLPTALAEKARKELNEDPELIDEKIQQFKQWILNQKHLKARTDDQWLLAFLRGCKYRMEQAKSKIDLYYSLRSTAPYLYSIKFNESKLIDLLNLGSVVILPKTLNPSEPRIIFYRLGRFDPKEYHIIDVLSLLSLMEQICFMEDDTFVVAGTIHVLDFAGTKFGHYTQTSLTHLRHIGLARQDAVPIRIKRIHFLNTPYFFETFFKVAKMILSEKNKQRILFHSKSALHDYFPKEIIPEEYGGTGDSFRQCVDYWKNKIREYDSFFEEDLKYGSDESKRLTKNDSIQFD